MGKKDNKAPRRVTDLIALKKNGSEVIIEPDFEVVLVDFVHKDHQFEAYIFLCRYLGTINGRHFRFRKCYSRGCPHNLCPHVAQAVMIANRYLTRDFNRLREAGINVPDKVFTLDGMVIKFEDLKKDQDLPMTIHDYIYVAREGNPVSIEVELESLPVVEHFANEKNKQTFLNADFTIKAMERTHRFHRCLACYASDLEKQERPDAVKVANNRLELLYREFDEAGIICDKHFFN